MDYILNNSIDPFYNMSFDEFCLSQTPSENSFFCLWRNKPSVIIGLNQNARSEVNLPFLESNNIALARRVTGGGAVYHDLQNLNYSIFRPLAQSTSENGADAVECIVEALRSMNVPAEQGGRNDIYVEGRKISGFARRIFHNRELVHGTLMYDVDISTLTKALDTPESKLNRKGVASVRSRVANLKDYLPQYQRIEEFRNALQEILSNGGKEIRLTEQQKQTISLVAQNKFSTPEWVLDHVKDSNSDAI